MQSWDEHRSKSITRMPGAEEISFKVASVIWEREAFSHCNGNCCQVSQLPLKWEKESTEVMKKVFSAKESYENENDQQVMAWHESTKIRIRKLLIMSIWRKRRDHEMHWTTEQWLLQSWGEEKKNFSTTDIIGQNKVVPRLENSKRRDYIPVTPTVFRHR